MVNSQFSDNKKTVNIAYATARLLTNTYFMMCIYSNNRRELFSVIRNWTCGWATFSRTALRFQERFHKKNRQEMM